MINLQNNLTTGELSLQGINSSGQRIFEKSLTPYPANALIGTSSSSQILVGNGAVSQITSKLLYNPVLKLPVKYPNLTDSENKFLKLNKEETKSGYTIIDNPYPAPSK